MSGARVDRVELVERFYRAFNAAELDDFVVTLHPEVELQTARGLRKGRQEAHSWATRSPDGALEQRILVEEVRVDDHGAHALALIRKQWWWRDAGEPNPAHDEPEAALFTFRDGLIARWQPFADRDEALALLDGRVSPREGRSGRGSGAAGRAPTS